MMGANRHIRSVPASSNQSWWLDSIGRIPLLSPAEEIELGTAIQRWQQHPDPCPPGIRRRGQRARDRFVSANLRLVVAYISKRCHRLTRSFDREDLTQAGNMGLITAAERFDPAKGYRFSTYAYWWIRQAINRWVDQHGRPRQPLPASSEAGRHHPTAGTGTEPHADAGGDRRRAGRVAAGAGAGD
jgi:RNA polymerase primary sigma factor